MAELDADLDRIIPSSVLPPFWAKLVVGFVSLVCFARSYDGDFVFDDSEAIINNKDLRAETPLGDLWHHDFWGSRLSSNTSHKSYRPLTVLTFRINYYLCGGFHPMSFHVINILLHGGISVLMVDVFSVLLGGLQYTSRGRRLNLAPRSSLLAALLFATHPVHTECVAGVVGRADLLGALFFLLSFLGYCKAFRENTGCDEFSLCTCHAYKLQQKFYTQFLLPGEVRSVWIVERSLYLTVNGFCLGEGDKREGEWDDFLWNVGVEPFKQERTWTLACLRLFHRVSQSSAVILHVVEAEFYEWRKLSDRNLWLMMVKFYFSHYAYVPLNEQFLQRAVLYFQYADLNRHVDALNAWRNATVLKPEHSLAWNNMIILLDNTGNLAQAEAVGREALELIPNDHSLMFSLANVLGKSQKYKESEALFLKAIKAHPNAASYHGNLAVLYHRWGHLNLAKKHYEISLQLDPTASGTKENYGLLRRKLEQVQKKDV
ncbi:protein O-mannosyl-transferase TMTC4-like [Leptonychotes weddellii]|uniref:Protein O-mannosyl-transferase TMTC4-like n=1 Tax=Leptonychotes weddellii TaxID=9713 RepID=A0A7F8Q9W4_LEPWE|nr:protein O-mannosyl-transferase TMTC4-like [Leptonychotes weddellii]